MYLEIKISRDIVMNKRSEIDNLPQNSGKNNVIKNLTSKILLSHFSINITCISNARFSPVSVFARADSSSVVLSRDFARARALGRINFMKSPLYSHRKHHTSVAASNGAATYSLCKRIADVFKGGTHTYVEPALHRSSSYRSVHSSAFCETTNGLPAGSLCAGTLSTMRRHLRKHTLRI